MLKKYLYDFGGLNEYLFLLINNFRIHDIFSKFMLMMSEIAYYKYLFPTCIIGFLSYGFIKYRMQFFAPNNRFLHFYISLLGGWFWTGLVVKICKHIFFLPRPVEVFSPDYIIFITKISNHHFHSLPSGHVAWITIFALSTAKYFSNKYYTKTMPYVIVLVAYSRIYLGQHFPADVIYSIIITVIVFMCSEYITKFLLMIWQKIYNKLTKKTTKQISLV